MKFIKDIHNNFGDVQVAVCPKKTDDILITLPGYDTMVKMNPKDGAAAINEWFKNCVPVGLLKELFVMMNNNDCY